MKELIILIFLSVSLGSYSQTQIITKPTTLKSIKAYEDSLKSLSKGLQNYNPYYDEDFEDIFESWPQVIYKPLIYKRINDDFFPTLHTWYFFDKDSIVKWIYFNWGFANTNVEASDSKIKKQQFREMEYRRKYEVEKMNLKNLLGVPTKEDLIKETASYLNLKSIWDLPDKKVVISMTLDKKMIKYDSQEVGKTIIFPLSEIIIKILMKE